MARQLTWYDVLDVLPGASAYEVQRAFEVKEGLLGAFAEWLSPPPAAPRRIALPDVRGLFVGPCRRLLSGTGLRIEVVRLTQDPMPVEGLIVDQSPPPGARSPRSGTVTVQVWHPPQPRPSGHDDRASRP
jgi:PASTA domain